MLINNILTNFTENNLLHLLNLILSEGFYFHKYRDLFRDSKLNIMTVKFCFGNKRKDGSRNLKIRLKNKGRDRKIGIEGVYIESKYWDKSNNRIKSTHPNAGAYNEIINKYQEKIIKVKGQLELKQIDFITAYRILSSASKTNSISEFVKIHCDIKSIQWKKNTLAVLNIVKGHLNLDDIRFDDITYENLQKLKKILKDKNITEETFNNYLRHIKAVYNYALKTKMTYREFIFPKDLSYRINKHNKKLETHTPQDIADAIDSIKIKSNHRSAKGYAIRDLEAIGFWMLQFSMRGLYPKDITALTSFNSDYNYAYRMEYMSQEAKQEPMQIKGNYHFLDHTRHKTGNMMRIWVTLPPIGGLIFILKRLVANTHPELSYLSLKDVTKKPDELYKNKNYDILKIFKHSTDDLAKDDAVWNNYNKHLRKLDLFSLQSARKSFNTTATHLRISPDIRKALLGQTDHSIQRSYTNYNDIRLVKTLQEAHLQIMNEFNMVELFDKWVGKLDELFGNFNYLKIGLDSRNVYTHWLGILKEVLRQNRIQIDKDDTWIENNEN